MLEECGSGSIFRSSDARWTKILTGSDAAVAEASFVVVRGRIFLQARIVARLWAGCVGMTSVSSKGRYGRGRRNVAPDVST